MKTLVLNNPWATKKSQKIKKYFKLNLNENKAY